MEIPMNDPCTITPQVVFPWTVLRRQRVFLLCSLASLIFACSSESGEGDSDVISNADTLGVDVTGDQNSDTGGPDNGDPDLVVDLVDDGRCSIDNPCVGGLLCSDGTCVGCIADGDCAVDERCDAHVCVERIQVNGECIFSNECTGALVCDRTTKTCVECRTGRDCQGGQVCIANDCVDPVPCQSDLQCTPSGLVCGPGYCVSCNSYADCPDGYACDAHACLLGRDCGSSLDCADLSMVCAPVGDFWGEYTSWPEEQVQGCVECGAPTDCPAETGCADGVCYEVCERTGSACGVVDSGSLGQAYCGDCTAGAECCNVTGANSCVDTTTDVHACGSCYNDCDSYAEHATMGCASSVCEVVACDAGYDDCDGDAQNGCEVGLATDVVNCGACGVVCSAANATAMVCIAGVCGVVACDVGYATDGVTCSDVNECMLNTDNCSTNAACTNTVASFTCSCYAGYGGDGVTCTDLDECALNTDDCDAAATCTNTAGRFTCACNAGYSGGGVTCTDLNECMLNIDNCGTNATCTNTDGGFTCSCNAGYGGDGVTCEDIDECTGNCLANGTCINTPGSFICACDAGYRWDGVTCTATFVTIPSGSFTMGSPPSELGRFPDEMDQHTMTLTRSFKMKTTEVTQGEWQSLMGNNPSNFSSCGANCPVEWVNWFEALAYANALSSAEGLAPCYTLTGCTGTAGAGMTCTGVTVTGASGDPYACLGYRLPTEPEWEYAYRAGTMSAFYNGGITNNGCADPNLDAIGWYCGNGNFTTHPAGQKQANGWGLYDMSGNVEEWCWDWYETNVRRVVRGGGLVSWAHFNRAAYRNGSDFPDTRSYIGFRLARSVPNCGDGFVDSGETCDDGNTMGNDGCTGCVVELGYTCTGNPSSCGLTGDSCGAAFDVDSSTGLTLVGTDFNAEFSDQEYFDGTGCVATSTFGAPAEVVFSVDLTAGQSVNLSEHTATDFVLSILKGCGPAVACESSVDFGETVGATYVASTNETVFLVVESYSGGVSVRPYDIRITVQP